MNGLIIDLEKIKQFAAEREKENDLFRLYLKQQDSKAIDEAVHQLNDTITPQIN